MKKLYKSRTDKKIDGVCAGIAKYLNLDPTVIRLLWIILAIAAGSGVLAYILCMIIIPVETDAIEE